MQLVFIIARDWRLRAMVRAELRERGIETVAVEAPAEAATQIAAGTAPTAVVLEASSEVEPTLETLARRVPFVIVASGIAGDRWPAAAARVVRRPARIGEIVAAVLDLFQGGPA